MATDGNPIKTDRDISQLPVPERGAKIWYAGDLAGFGVRVTAAGVRTFVLNYRVRGTGQERRYSIGRTDSWRLKAARDEAQRLRRIVDLGGDPLGDLGREREQAEEERKRRKTVVQLADRFEAEHLPSLRPATKKFYRLALKNHIRPALGRHLVEDVTTEDVRALHASLSDLGQKHQANQVATLAGVLFKYAEKWGWRTGGNPARDVEKHTLEGRERYLTPAELRRLQAALPQVEDRQAAAIFRVLLYTGARIGETVRMRWEQIDFERGMWTKPAATTKQKKVHRLPLTAPVLAVLAEIQQQQRDDAARLRSPAPQWVFPGGSKDGHRSDLRIPWLQLLKLAEIEQLRVHDLRHTFASVLAGGGFSLGVIGAALGHSRFETTQRYAHFADEPVRMAMTRAADLLTAAENPETAEIIDLPRRS
jgi:integrase